MTITRQDLVKISNNIFEIPKNFRSDMRVPARVFATEKMLADILHDRSLEQLINVATLPGIQKYALAMPDIHQGYGFPIGGVAGMAIHEGGVISPGGIGYDINCGVRLLISPISFNEIKPYLAKLADELFRAIPSGVGHGGYLKLNTQEMNAVLRNGAHEMVNLGYGTLEDAHRCEEEGRMADADPSLISDAAKKRGHDQLGTLGSGNHFLEVQRIADIFDEKTAQAYGLHKDCVTIMIHCGSRGLGHQVCTDYVKLMMREIKNLNITLPDRELVCAPFTSNLGQDYFAAMAAACNFAWANRHMITHNVRQAWHKILGDSIPLSTMYDLSHNIGKREKHSIDGSEIDLIVHRKGATRSFGPGHHAIPLEYRSAGQPVFIPGTMGTSSYVLAGTTQSMDTSFGSSCHGAGRKMSRMQSKRTEHGSTLRESLEAQGILIRCDSDPGLAEEAPSAYKDIDNVVDVVHNEHIARKVVQLKPLAVIKGG